jgi:hypothetical protein
VKDAFGRGYSRKRSECGACGRNDTVRSRAALGIMLTGITTGPGGAFPGLGQAGAGNARLGTRGLRPPVGATVQDRTSRHVPGAWPGVAPKGRKPRRQEPRWNADRRARPAGHAPHPMMRAVGSRVCRRFASFFGCLPEASLKESLSELNWETFSTARFGLLRLLVRWRGGWQNSGADRVAGTPAFR